MVDTSTTVMAPQPIGGYDTFPAYSTPYIPGYDPYPQYSAQWAANTANDEAYNEWMAHNTYFGNSFSPSGEGGIFSAAAPDFGNTYGYGEIGGAPSASMWGYPAYGVGGGVQWEQPQSYPSENGMSLEPASYLNNWQGAIEPSINAGMGYGFAPNYDIGASSSIGGYPGMGYPGLGMGLTSMPGYSSWDPYGVGYQKSLSPGANMAQMADAINTNTGWGNPFAGQALASVAYPEGSGPGGSIWSLAANPYAHNASSGATGEFQWVGPRNAAASQAGVIGPFNGGYNYWNPQSLSGAYPSGSGFTPQQMQALFGDNVSPYNQALFAANEINSGGYPSVYGALNNPNATMSQMQKAIISGFEVPNPPPLSPTSFAPGTPNYGDLQGAQQGLNVLNSYYSAYPGANPWGYGAPLTSSNTQGGPGPARW